MTLSEERQEPNEQSWWKWRSREKRERQKLSASVEETLIDPVEQEQDKEDEAVKTGTDALIPPLLSLQSRPMPTVHPGSFVESATRAQYSEISKETQQSPSATPPTQSTGKLARFAQRLTSSLAVFGSTMSYDNFPALPSPLPGESQQLSRFRDSSLLPPASDTSTAIPDTAPQQPQALPDALLQVPASPVEPSPSGQRLAGHTTKIRLETASMPAISKPQERPHDKDNRHERHGERVEARISTTSSQIPAVDRLQAKTEIKSTHLPISEPLSRTAGEGIQQITHGKEQAITSGSDVFETGQCDISVSNPGVTSTSVVLVMLTANPGPVVVQYISLQPQVGFTVHLTAPATTQTTFNYVIL